MAIVIHDFEVVPKQETTSSAAAAPAKETAPQSLTPRDVIHIERHHRARGLRVWAH